MKRRSLQVGPRNGARRPGVRARWRGYEALESRDLLTGLAPVAALPDTAPVRLNPPALTADFRPLGGQGIDYGDAPETYPVRLVDQGAGHRIVAGFHLGQFVDAEPDGQPAAMADADASDDGVIFTPMVSGQLTTITVYASRGGFVDAWLDMNGDGDWDDPGEQILNSEPVVSGSSAMTFRVVATAVGVPTYTRFRLSSTGGLSPRGLAADGEVEDYAVTILPNPWHNLTRPGDINGDSEITPLDALLIINLINAHPPISFAPLPVPPDPAFRPPPYYDVNGDGYVTPMDVLLIINYLNGLHRGGAGEGEGLPGGEMLVQPTHLPPPVVVEPGALAGRRDPWVRVARAPAAGGPVATAAADGPQPWRATRAPADAVFGVPWTGDRRRLQGGTSEQALAQFDELLEDLLQAADPLQPVSARAAYFARLAGV